MPNILARLDFWLRGALGPAVAGAQIYLCSQPANITTVPSPLVSLYADQAGVTPIQQPLISDGLGHVQCYAPSQLYTLVIVVGGRVQNFYTDQFLSNVSGSAVLPPSGSGPFVVTSTTNLVTAPAGDIITADGSGNIQDSGVGISSLAPVANPAFTGEVVLTNTAGPQLELKYDSGRKLDVTVDSNGDTAIVPTGGGSIFFQSYGAFSPLVVGPSSVTAPNLDNVLYGLGFGMVGDGVTDNTAAFTAALASASALGTARLVIAPGVYMLQSQINIPDNIEICGSGKYSTTLKLKVAQNNNMFMLAGTNTGVTFSDLTLDGNKSGQSSTSWIINSSANTVSNLTLRNCRFQNAYDAAVYLFTTPSTHNPTNIEIIGCDFINNGTNNGSDTTGQFGDMSIPGVTNFRAVGNLFSGTGGTSISFGAYTPAPHPSNIVISDNLFVNVLGFAVALGGGPVDPLGSYAIITNNVFNMPTSVQNLVDLSTWSNVTVSNNIFQFGGTANAKCAIGDAPDAHNISICGNRIIGTSGSSAGFAGITLGASNSVICNNFITLAGGNGITIAITNTTAVKNILISGNIVSDCGQVTGNGIATFIPTGGSGALSNILIIGNSCFDDQGSTTQGYGISLAAFGQTTGYSNITVVNNELPVNKIGAIQNNTSATGLLISNNPGDTTAIAGTTYLSSVQAPTLILTAVAPTTAAAQVSFGSTTASTVGAAGGASALPATPVGYMIINVAGTARKIPYYTT